MCREIERRFNTRKKTLLCGVKMRGPGTRIKVCTITLLFNNVSLIIYIISTDDGNEQRTHFITVAVGVVANSLLFIELENSLLFFLPHNDFKKSITFVI